MKYIGCGTCEKDYKKIIQCYPVRYASRIELFNWTVDIHNIINAKLGKEQIDYDQAYQLWSTVIPAPPLAAPFVPCEFTNYPFDRVDLGNNNRFDLGINNRFDLGINNRFDLGINNRFDGYNSNSFNEYNNLY